MPLTRHDDLSLRYVTSIPSDVGRVLQPVKGRVDGLESPSHMPLVVVLHGRGADANDLADIAPMLDGPEGYRFVFANAPKPFEPYPGMTFGWTWFDGWPPTRESIAESRAKLLAFLDEIVDRYPPKDGKIVLAGFSQGGMMALDVGFRTALKLRGIVVMSGAIYEEELPGLRARRDQRVLIVHGTQDDMIPVIAARRTRRVLEEHGIEPEYHEFAMGHHVTEESMAVVSEFIRRCMT
jgi:phospholipase/carboxylesterase